MFADGTRASLPAIVRELNTQARCLRSARRMRAPRSLRQQSLDHTFGRVITAFADMEPADAALFVEHKDRGPGFDVVGLPGLVIIVGDHRILDAEGRHFAADVVDAVLTVGFGRVYAHDR